MAKRNGNMAKWIAIIITLLFAAVGWIYSMGVQGNQLDNNCKSDDLYHPQIPVIDNRVTKVEVKIENIDKNMMEQKTMQQQILNKQEEILWELTR